MIPCALLRVYGAAFYWICLEDMYAVEDENKTNTKLYMSMLTFEMVCMHNLDLQRISTKIPLDT
jgi:hypothetical protein